MSTIILNPFEIFGGGVIPRNGLVAEYLANNNFLDTSGNGYDGVNNNVTFGNDRDLNPNSAFVFNGTTTFVDIDASLAGLATNTKGTWSMWVKPVDATPILQEEHISFADTDGNTLIHLTTRQSGACLATCRVAGVDQWEIQTSNKVFFDNVWTHIAIVQDGNEPVLYIGGIQVSQFFSVSTNKTVWFTDLPTIDNGRIGSINLLNLGEIQHFNGSIDDIRIYDRGLSQSEITILANE